MKFVHYMKELELEGGNLIGLIVVIGIIVFVLSLVWKPDPQDQLYYDCVNVTEEQMAEPIKDCRVGGNSYGHCHNLVVEHMCEVRHFTND